MTEDMGKPQGGGVEESGDRFNNGRERKVPEGFEGMNYEQRRQPYRSQNAGYSNSVQDEGDMGRKGPADR